MIDITDKKMSETEREKEEVIDSLKKTITENRRLYQQEKQETNVTVKALNIKIEELEIKLNEAHVIIEQQNRQTKQLRNELEKQKKLKLSEQIVKSNQKKEQKMTELEDSSMIKQQLLAKFKNENEEINKLMKTIRLPLQKFTSKDVANVIKWWKYNDVNYNKYL
eukprot:168360_1